ncbi:MAG: nucleoside kinase [Spirochaetaceae bacterium]|nr:nucleoside kinase [Spirochaetaceae bacterium]
MRDISFKLPSGQLKQLPVGSTLNLLAKDGECHNAVAFVLNNQLIGLNQSVLLGGELKPIFIADKWGLQAYRRSLNLLLMAAVNELYPAVHFVIGQTVADAYFYRYSGELPDNYLEAINQKMQTLVAASLAINHTFMSYQEALTYFNKMGQSYSHSLLEYSNEATLAFYQLGATYSLDYGLQLPNTSLLSKYQLIKGENGFFLRYPTNLLDSSFPERQERPLVMATYREHRSWVAMLGSDSVGNLNKHLRHKASLQRLIHLSEGLHDKKVAAIADQIAGRGQVKFVFIAGPSSSGKTTFTKKLAMQLEINGFKPHLIGLDHFYTINRDAIPLTDKGEKDLEHIKALDLPLINQTLTALIKGDKVAIPKYSFKTKERTFDAAPLELTEKSIVLIEGIHGLNEQISASITSEHKFKIYISALIQLNIDEQHRLSTSDSRLIRRIVRDWQFRNTGASDTLAMWPNVKAGEEKWIFPYQETADVAFNSALDYELFVLKGYIEALLKEVKANMPHYHEACRLLRYLERFQVISAQYVPNYSILREFIGDSGYKY